jgi:enolase
MPLIAGVIAREVLDSRGNPTVWARVTLADGTVGEGIAPSGASTGWREAVELRDGDPERYNCKGVLKAVENVNDTIASAIIGKDATDQAGIDSLMCELDGTPEKKVLGANAILSVSLAAARASAASGRMPLYQRIGQLAGNDSPTCMPIPMFNILNGGAHASGSTDLQEFMIFPTGIREFESGLRAAVEIYSALKSRLEKDGHPTGLGDEGGFAPSGLTTREALDYIIGAIKKAGYEPGEEITLALDAAASEFYCKDSGLYNLKREEKKLDFTGMIEMYADLLGTYPIVSIEDGLAEDDWDGWAEMTSQIGNRVQLVGDDLLVTQSRYIQKGIDEKAANAVLIKLNQVGTVTETLKSIALTKSVGWGTVVSHRSGETEDTTIADLAVGTGAGQIKTGAPARGERTAKYNRLLVIGDDIGADATRCSPWDNC